MINIELKDFLNIMDNLTTTEVPIEVLSIDSNNFIGDKGLNELCFLFQNGVWKNNLYQLCLDDINIGRNGIISLYNLFQSNKFDKLQYFDINENKIGDNGIEYVVNILKENCLPNLSSLGLSCIIIIFKANPITDKGVELLIDAFKNNYCPNLYQLKAHCIILLK